MKNKQEIENLLKTLNNNLLNISENLIKAFEKYQRDYERELFKQNFDTKDGKLKANIQNYNKAQSLSINKKLGFNDLAIKMVKQYDEVAKENLIFNKRIGIQTSLTFNDLTIVKQLKELDLSNLWNEAQRLEGLVKRNLVNAIAMELDYKETISNLAEDLLGAGDKLGLLAKYSETYIRTSIFNLGRMIDQEIYDDVGGDRDDAKYIYLGPLDGKTREFCQEHVGEIKTKKEWEEIGEKEGVDIFIEGGGWNCRHKLILIG